MKIEIALNERTIIEGVIDEVNTEWVQKAVDNHLAETNFAEHLECDLEAELDPMIENFMTNMNLGDYIDVNDYIDTDDIRYEIEDDILEQVNDHLDYDTIKYNIEDDIAESLRDEFNSNFDIDEHLDYDEIRSIMYESISEIISNYEVNELQDRVEALEETVAQLELVLSQNPPRKVGLIRRFLGWLW